TRVPRWPRSRRSSRRDNEAVLQEADAPAAQWIMSTTGDGTWTFVNAATGRLLDVVGQSTADGARVSAFLPTSAANQRWGVTDETVLRTQPARAFTVPGHAPDLPATVTPVFRDGARGALPVEWTLPSASRWREPGTVRVKGRATDALGRTVPAEAVVTVDTVAATLPARAKTYTGGRPGLPATVTGVGRHGGTADLPVTWDAAPDGAFDETGVVTLRGTARVPGGTTAAATARVQVTAPRETNAARDEGVTVGATYTESGYSAEGLRNGNTSEKAWSNWKSGTKNPSDTITLTLPEARDLTRVVTHFHRDGTNVSFAESLKVQVRGADGTWADASDTVPVGTEGTPVADVPVRASGPVTGVRVVMTARPGGYITLGEIEVYAKAPGTSADAAAASIEVDGTPLSGFDPDRTSYRTAVDRPDRARVTATPRDPYAKVTVREDTSRGRTAHVVSVTAEDGSQTREYRIELTRR
ncbi:Ig-like domain-containing protein, partial [Streptomyces sp. NPDC006386]|uniref:RICIN domain-containing protein n=1 Tax=Streptomyces sp. NPDC006386 TaxID=3156762 RepID=UPI0033B94DFB